MPNAWATAYDEYGGALVFTHQVAELQLQLQEFAGGAWVDQDPEGRSFVQRIYDARGVTILEIEGAYVASDTGSYWSFPITSEQLLTLMPEGERAVDLQHSVGEALPAGLDLQISAAPFLVRFGPPA